MTGNWAMYSWTPAIMLASAMSIFVVDVVAQKYVADRYGLDLHANVESIITGCPSSSAAVTRQNREKTDEEKQLDTQKAEKVAFAQQFAAFLILEFGIIWHSIFIGLNFGVAGSEWSTLYIVLMFHQGFEGLGIGARLSMIPMPSKYANWLPWLCIAGYGVTTPISMAVGLGLRTTYNSGSYESVSLLLLLLRKAQ